MAEGLFNKNLKNDEIFIDICKDVALSKHDIVTNNYILKQSVMDVLIRLMRKSDQDFDKMFADIIYAGSFYKRLKISKPDEFDLNLVIQLPVDLNAIQIDTNQKNHGSAKIKVNKNLLYKNEKFLINLLGDDNYIDQNKFRYWMQSVVDKSLKNLHKETSNVYVIKTRKHRYYVKWRQNNPAFTFEITRNETENKILFDFVPCFKFPSNLLQYSKFRLPEADYWITIAKPMEYVDNGNLLWRASFYADEKNLLKGHVKAIIRVVKKLRDAQMWDNLKSYHIETLFLNEMEFLNKIKYEHTSRMQILMYMLEKLQQILESKKLWSYWHNEHNLFENFPKDNLQDIANRLRTIINNIDRKPIYLKEYCGLIKNNKTN